MILHQYIDYETLRIIWWLLLGVLLIGFAVMDGFDLGAAALLPFVAKTDVERRVVINSIGPTWEGNQVWLILGGGAIFAAWPPLYAVSFSGFYLAMFAILFALILRPVGFKYRSKLEGTRWRETWDWALFIGGAVPALIFGVAVGNVLRGVPFHFNGDLRIFYDGTTLFELLNPFALLCGLVSVAMLVMHGAAWIILKSEGPIADRARSYGSLAALVTIALFIIGGVVLWVGIDGYQITSAINPVGPSNPLAKTVIKAPSVWFNNYGSYPLTILAPVLGVIGAGAAYTFMRARREIATILASSLSIAGIITTVGVSIFPFLLPSSVDPRSSLTVWDASSSHLTLFIMFVCAVIFVPIVIAYTTWVYHVMWGKVDEKAIRDDHGHAY